MTCASFLSFTICPSLFLEAADVGLNGHALGDVHSGPLELIS